MDKMLWILDAGHGGLSPAGEYTTGGKRSPIFPDNSFTADGKALPDGYVLYEGVNNRDNVKRIIERADNRGIKTHELVPGYEDLGLGSRCRLINRINSENDNKAITISMHSNAAGSNGSWSKATGNGIYIYPKASKRTRAIAKIMEEEFKSQFPDMKWRGIKERNFAILRETHTPSILIEAGFHDNLEEAKYILSEEYKDRLICSVIHTIERYENSI